ncbi:putative transcription factor interactor and regulator CCHC(Zn) family [Helianthus annuus]|nr:putative transcription factor interactor and regulator CCHC(Zn) family [Helianthus annuus]KAJ0459025.1 putative transcription factor interactor and regulator CCHC(Zn) family [Helianthus annuus]KAJ0643537.1 putative transcription factor interactor and regulator CCHC(Zn) family [Helianthus annuus]
MKGKNDEEEVRVIKVKEVPAFEIKKEAVAEKVSENCENCETMKKHNNELIHNMNRLKESYDVLNKAMNQYNESSSEQATTMKTLNGAYMIKQDMVNYYIGMCAERGQKLETQRIETEILNKLLKSYSCSSYVIDRIYPTVEGMKAFEEKIVEEKKFETKEDTEVKNSGACSEEEEKSSFWKQTNKEFLAKKQEGMKNVVVQKKETRTCFQCKIVGHIARNCPKAIQTKQGVSLKLKEKMIENEPPTKPFKIFKNSKFEVGECSKRFYKRKVKLDNQRWIVKESNDSSSNDSDSSKSEELFSGDESDSSKSEDPPVDWKS